MTRLLIATICFGLISCSRPADKSVQYEDQSLGKDSVVEDLKTQTVERMQGTWMHTEDSLAIVEIKGDKWIFSYVGDDIADYDRYNIQLTDTMTSYLKNHNKTLFMILTNDSTELDYEVLTLTDDIMDLMYYPRGNTHTYKRVK